MSQIDREYHRLLYDVQRTGYKYEDPNRAGVFRTEIPNFTFTHEFKTGFPLITTRELNYNNIVVELLWFLKGKTNIKYLLDNGCNIWNKDAYKHYCRVNKSELESMDLKTFIKTIRESDSEDLKQWFPDYTLGDLGPVYGRQWRNSNGVDQIKNLIDGLVKKPMGTEHIVNSWNVGEIKDMALPPCHFCFQVIVRPLSIVERFNITPNARMEDVDVNEDDCHAKYLDALGVAEYGFELHWDQRSVDTFLGLPYNIASYATLALILEKITGYKAISIQGDLKKVHLYDNSLSAAAEQIKNDPYKNPECKLIFPENAEDPNGFDFTLKMGYSRNLLTLDEFIEEMSPDWFAIEGYESYPPINVLMLEKD